MGTVFLCSAPLYWGKGLPTTPVDRLNGRYRKGFNEVVCCTGGFLIRGAYCGLSQRRKTLTFFVQIYGF